MKEQNATDDGLVLEVSPVKQSRNNPNVKYLTNEFKLLFS